MSDPLPSSGLTRRQLVRQVATGALAFPALNLPLSAATPPSSAARTPPALRPLAPLQRLPRVTQDFLVERVSAIERQSDAARAALRTRADAERYRADVQRKIHRCFGAFPERTPLNARVTKVLPRDTYRIENVIFESRPGFLVTANLYVPEKRAGRSPAVLGTCGHAEAGKAAPTYQAFAQGLARQGYVVLIFDPVGQGERGEYFTAEGKPSKGTGGVREHLHAGNQQMLVGETFAAWSAWDGMRALDYLLSRPEVDPQHVGVTGNSGGGTQATWLCALDPRITMAATGCFVTTFRRNAENELAADTEQCPPHALALGLDHSDFYAAFAPKPVALLGQELDFFDARGLEEAAQRLRQFYGLFDAADRVHLHLGSGNHGYAPELREAMYRWFNRITGVSDRTTEPTITLESPEVLHCTPTGRVADAGTRTVFSFTQERSRALHRHRLQLRRDGDVLTTALRELLHLPAESHVPDYRILRPASGRGYPMRHAATYVLYTEPPAATVVYRLHQEQLLARPPRGARRAFLYVSDRSADAELRDDDAVRTAIAAEPDAAIYACDLRGIGESEPDTCGRNHRDPYGSDYFYAVHGVMLDRPVPGQRTHDLLCVLAWLRAHGHEEIHVFAQGEGATPATFAAVLSPLVTRITLKQALTSFREVAESQEYSWPLSAFVPGALLRFDLPDCYAALAAKGLRQLEPRGA